MASLKLLIIAHDLPFPPTHGGRVDIWGRIMALNERNIPTRILCWSDAGRQSVESEPPPEKLRTWSRYFIGKKERFRAAFQVALPFGAGTHVLDGAALRKETGLARSLGVDAVLLDGIYGAQPALEIAHELGCPLIYRAHNIESRHMRDQIFSASGPAAKFRFALDFPRMRALERRVRQAASATFEICDEDREYWSARGFPEPAVLPPFVDGKATEMPLSGWRPATDVLFVGNLHHPNNIEGLNWLLEQVLSPLSARLSVTLAGSHPSPELLQLADRHGVAVIENPADLREIYGTSRVVVNPSQRASGVNLKSVEMLATGLRFVCTPAALRGIPASLHRWPGIGRSPEEFRELLVQALRESKGPDLQQRRETLAIFGGSQLEELLKALPSGSED